MVFASIRYDDFLQVMTFARLFRVDPPLQERKQTNTKQSKIAACGSRIMQQRYILLKSV